MSSDPPPDPCPHLPYADTPIDPNDPFAGRPELPPGQTWHQFPYHPSFTADPLWYDTAGRDMLIQKRVFMLPSDDDQVRETLRIVDAFPRRERDALFYAAMRDRPHIVRALLERGVRVHPVADEGDDDSLVPLHAAAFHGNLECVKVLIEVGHVDPDFCDVTSTPLMRAALAGHPDVVRYLLATGKVDLKKEFISGGRARHPLEWIVRSRNAETANVLIDALVSGVSSEDMASSVPNEGISAAACEGNMDILNRLLELRGALVRDGDDASLSASRGVESTIEAAVRGAATAARIETINHLLELAPGLSLDNIAKSDEGKKPFHNGLLTALDAGDVERFDFLASRLFRDGYRLSDGPPAIQSCIGDAVAAGSLPLVKLLIEKYGADVDGGLNRPGSIPPVANAASRNNMEIVRYLLEEAPVQPELMMGTWTNNIRPLWYAIREKNVDMVKLMLRKSAPIDRLPGELPPEPLSFFRIAACLDPDREVRVYLKQEDWDAAPKEEIRAHMDLNMEDEDFQWLILGSYG